MRDNVNILEKYTENLIVKKNLLQTTVDAYKLDINEYLEFLTKKNIDILDTDEKIFNEYFSDVEKNYKKATFSRKYSTIRGLYKFLLKNRYIEKIFEYKLSVNKSDNEVTTKKNNIIFKQKEYEEFINSLSDNFNEMRLKLISKMIVEYKISLVNIFEIQIKDLLKYDFQKIIIVRNNKIISYDIDRIMEEDLKNYYKKYAFEKRFLFGVYGKLTFISDLKRYNLDFKTLKNCMREDEKDLIENIRKMYFEIGIGDN
ncbi:transposase [Fusobacterium polymorphum]|uniref:Transposase n=1 Tax=Fusobacterium nucleatum subsp. polymorphum TaxID=76857 RepID=A0A241Q4E1_FUSNP|nr:site-specific integrase [Fusobacterium nucleatum]ASG29469.1 transposase [Fusobacterium polymorphum]